MKNGQFDQILIRTQGGQALFRETCVGPSEEAMSRHGVHNRLCRQILNENIVTASHRQCPSAI